MSKREKLPAALKRAIKERDRDACQKCGRRYALNIHHITRLMDGGTDDIDNLATLCGPCHNEWHIMDITLSPKFFSYAQWLTVPPAAVLVKDFLSIPYDDPRSYGQYREDAMIAQSDVFESLQEYPDIAPILALSDAYAASLE